MSGGLGGMEMDEVPAVRIESPGPQKRSGKGGKGRWMVMWRCPTMLRRGEVDRQKRRVCISFYSLVPDGCSFYFILSLGPNRHIYTCVTRFASTFNTISSHFKNGIIFRTTAPRSRERRAATKVGRGQDATEDAVVSDREVPLELEEHPGMVGLGIRLEKDSGRLNRLGTSF